MVTCASLTVITLST